MKPSTSVLKTKSTLLKKLWNKIVDYFQAYKDEWLAYVAVMFLAGAFITTICFLSKLIFGVLPPFFGWEILPKVLSLSFIGTTWVLAGTLWAFLGVYVAPKQLPRFEDMAAQNYIPASEIIRAFRVASDFAKSGAVFIIIGTLMLLFNAVIN